MKAEEGQGSEVGQEGQGGRVALRSKVAKEPWQSEGPWTCVMSQKFVVAWILVLFEPGWMGVDEEM